ncbi:MAG: outer membrane beta-barrel protein [Burkholderiales bacterium]
MNKILTTLALGAAFMATTASAQPYVGAGFGQSKTDSHNTSGTLYGGYQFNPNFGAELAYNDFGNYRGASADSWSLAAVGTLPLDNNWDIFGKVGGTRNHMNFAGSSHHDDFLLGAGIAYNINKNVAVRLEYDDFGKLPMDVNGMTANVSNWGLSVKYTF